MAIVSTLIGVLLLSCALLFLQSLRSDTAHAAVGINKQINFQGKVTNPNGTNVANGTYTFVFRLYTVSTAGSAIWTETDSLTVTDGIFQVNLGAVTALPGSVDFNSDNIYLGITFNSDPQGEMLPRIRFTASPYAFNADALDGLDSGAFVQLSPSGQQTGNINVSGSATLGNGLVVSAGGANITGDILFANGASRTISVNAAASGAGNIMTIRGGNGTGTDQNGGNLLLQGGNSTGTGTPGSVIVRPQTNTTAAFLVQNSAGGTNVFAVDTTNSLVRVNTTASTTLGSVAFITSLGEFTTTLRVGDGTNGVEFSGSTGPLYRGTARPTKRITLAPEYPGATMTGDGSANSGTMTSDFCSGTSRKSILTTFCGATDEFNFYQWKSQSGTNDYDIYVRYQLPSDYDTGSITAINMTGWRSTSSDIVQYEMYNASGGQCGTTTTVNSSNTTWQETALASIAADGDCTSTTANELVIFKVKLTSSGSTNSALAGAIRFDYRAKF
jgi:hypothetical protein